MYAVGAAQPNLPLDARGAAALPLNTWTHLAATYDGTTLRLFVNGSLVGSRAVASPLLTSTGVLRFGGNSVWGEFFAGRIDEVRLYNRALTAAEIQADMAAPIGTDTTPPARSNGQPTGALPAGTTQATLSLITNESATCRYGTTAGVAYASLPNTFTTTGGTSHTTVVTGLANGVSYTYYVKCRDAADQRQPGRFHDRVLGGQSAAAGHDTASPLEWSTDRSTSCGDDAGHIEPDHERERDVQVRHDRGRRLCVAAQHVYNDGRHQSQRRL